MKEFRFSDDGGCSLLNIVNYAPLLCVPQHNPYDSNVLCATPEPGPLPKNITWGQSSIIVEGGYLCGIPVAILLEQIPNQLVLRDTVNLPGAPSRRYSLFASLSRLAELFRVCLSRSHRERRPEHRRNGRGHERSL